MEQEDTITWWEQLSITTAPGLSAWCPALHEGPSGPPGHHNHMQKSILKIKLNIGLPFIPAIPLLGRTEIIANRTSNTQSQMYTAALFTVAKCPQQVNGETKCGDSLRACRDPAPHPHLASTAPRFNTHVDSCLLCSACWLQNYDFTTPAAPQHCSQQELSLLSHVSIYYQYGLLFLTIHYCISLSWCSICPRFTGSQ